MYIERRTSRETMTMRLGAGTAAIVGLIIGLALSHAVRVQGQLATVTAERFVLTDSAGLERAALSLNKFGLPSLQLYDPPSHARMTLELIPNDAARILVRSQQHGSVLLQTFEDGMSQLSFYDQHGRLGVAVGMDQGSPYLTFFDSEGRVIGQLP
jgi:hypothetical protein